MSGLVEPKKRGRPRKDALVEKADDVVAAYVALKDAEDVPVVEHPAFVAVEQPSRPCALDDAPVGSKVVVNRTVEGDKIVRLTTPQNDGMELPKQDIAYSLPIGAKIRRTMPTVFEATQLDPSVVMKPLLGVTARGVIGAFREHFHPKD